MQAPYNFLFITSDQHRHDYMGCAGMESAKTPNLDRLAAEGTRFTTAITPCPLCVPARVSLATGRYPENLGCRNNQYLLPPKVPTYYQHLRDSGYRVAGIGKFDLGKEDLQMSPDGARPSAFSWGFTDPIEYEGKIDASNPERPYGYYTHLLEREGLHKTFREDYLRRGSHGWVKDCEDSALPEEFYGDTRIGMDSVDWLESVPESHPWHLFVSFLGPHDPFDPPTSFAEKYQTADVPLAAPAGDTSSSHVAQAMEKYRKAVSRIEKIRRQYLAQIDLIDAWTGKMLEVLERRGLLKNTIIVYTSDHGEMLGDRGLFLKQMPYDPSIRIPLIVSGPSLPRNQTNESLVLLNDIYSTFCEIAGLDDLYETDGCSFYETLKSGDRNTRQHVEVLHEQFSVIRTAKEKLITNRCGMIELYDLINDPLELQNCADSSPERVKALQALSTRNADLGK